MGFALIGLKLTLGLGILNVWLFRRQKSTPFRGGDAKSMLEEFKHYGLPEWSFPVIGTSKVVLALTILAGLWQPQLAVVGAAGLALFMMGAVLMHIRVQDSLVKTAPSLLMLILCALLIFGQEPSIITNVANL